MRVLDLFSGIGGFSLGLERAGMETVAFCEIDKFCQKVLKKHWPQVPIFEDITKLDGKQFYGTVDVVCGGFPCQPFSIAGKQRGEEDNRDLWPEMFRVIKEAKPTWIVGENVAGFVNMAFERTASDLESEGYEVEAFIIPACAVTAPHRRDRIWIIAYSHGNSTRQNRYSNQSSTSQLANVQETQQERNCPSIFNQGCFGLSSVSSNSTSTRLEGENWSKSQQSQFARFNEWEAESPICRDDYGLPYRMERIKALGNAVVPQIPEIIGKLIMRVHNTQEQS